MQNLQFIYVKLKLTTGKGIVKSSKYRRLLQQASDELPVHVRTRV